MKYQIGQRVNTHRGCGIIEKIEKLPALRRGEPDIIRWGVKLDFFPEHLTQWKEKLYDGGIMYFHENEVSCVD